jgi:hypothetical protein
MGELDFEGQLNARVLAGIHDRAGRTDCTAM